MGTAIGYDILVFDKKEYVAYLEVESSASNSRRVGLTEKVRFHFMTDKNLTL